MKRGKRNVEKCVRIQSINNCPKKKIFSSLFTPKHLSIRSNLSNTNNTKLLHHVVFSLVFAKGKNFSLFSLASRERRELNRIAHWIFNCDPIQLFKLPVHAIFPRVQNTRRVFTHALFSASSSSSSFKRNESTGHPRHQPDGSVLRRLHLR